MQIGMIGLGRMGMNMARRLIKGGHEVVVYNRTLEKVKAMEKEGAVGSGSIEELVKTLSVPRVLWIMLPAGEIVDRHIKTLSDLVSRDDILIDGGNSYFKDDIRRAEELNPHGIRYMDAGVSGGIWGLKIGYCTMIGGDEIDFKHIEPLLKTLAPPDGYLYCGPSGAGHFVKMVHNGIEYAMMEAYGEGFELLEASKYKEYLNYNKVAHLWNQGSVITIRGYVEDSGEGRWTVQQAVESGVSAPAITHSLFRRFESRQAELFSDKILAALRNEFGGHAVKTKKEG
jgi:6-phosphogluconate dehydrogenase